MNVQTIGIIGHGDFGRFIEEITHKHFPAVEVRVFSTRQTPDQKRFFSLEETCKADMVFPTVPISAYKETLQKIKPLLGSGTIVCDVATVKGYTVDLLHSLGIPHFIATHPMFGPFSYEKLGGSFKGLRVALCDHNLEESMYSEMCDFLKRNGLAILEMSADEHDRLVAETLFLTHLVGQIVHTGKFERTSIDTISFGYLMDAVESVAHDAALFREVFAHNPYCKDVMERFDLAERDVKNMLL